MTSIDANNVFRRDEILALTSIYDEIHIETDLSGSLTIPIALDAAVRLHSPSRDEEVRFLPGIEFSFSTGDGYPETEPPEVCLQCSWLSANRLRDVVDELKGLWDSSRELCLFSMIDELCDRSMNCFEMEIVDVTEEVFDQVVAFAENEETRRFKEGVYYCAICLEHKKGTECFKLPRCAHAFCKVPFH
jgi:E3 ubiquitin-protein ligase RNF14